MFLLEQKEYWIIFLLLIISIKKVQQMKCLFILKLKMTKFSIMVKNVTKGNMNKYISDLLMEN